MGQRYQRQTQPAGHRKQETGERNRARQLQVTKLARRMQNPNSECRMNSEMRTRKASAVSDFSFRFSFGFRHSEFGFAKGNFTNWPDSRWFGFPSSRIVPGGTSPRLSRPERYRF